MKDRIKKNFFWNTIGSTLNAMVSLFFMIAVTRINGSDKAGIFTFALSTSCLLQVIGLYSGRTYQVTERNKNITDDDFIYNKLFCCLIMLIASLLFVAFRGYDGYKISVILTLVLYKLIEAFAECIYAIIQKKDELYKVGISLFLKGLIATILFVLVDLLTHNLILSIIAIILTQLIILFFYDLKNVSEINFTKLNFNKKNILWIFKMGACTFLVTLLTQYVINAPKYTIDSYLTNSSQTIFGIIVMPATLVILCGQFLIHPFLNKLANYLKEKKFDLFNKTIIKLCFLIFLLGLFIIVVAHFIGIPFLELVYGIPLQKYLYDLIIILFGATFFGISFVISNALIALRYTFAQVIIFIISSIFTFFASRFLIINYELLGASLAYTFTMITLALLFIIYYIYKIRKVFKNEKI